MRLLLYEINGRPRLACMTRMSLFDPAETITITRC
jgi:succinate dehydrogenase / fumarate reductase iron-sulfur subunit